MLIIQATLIMLTMLMTVVKMPQTQAKMLTTVLEMLTILKMQTILKTAVQKMVIN